MHTLLLSADDVRQTVRHIGLDGVMDRAIDALTLACRDYDAGSIRTPARAGFSYTDPAPGLLEWMPALGADGRATIKIVGYHPRNPDERQLPTILSVVAQCETATGHLTALLDGTLLTAIRTGAASAVASRHLARMDGRTVGLLGCGTQAVTQIHGLSRVLDFDTVLHYDIDRVAMDSLRGRLSHLALNGVRIEAGSVETVVQQADILCTTTSIPPGEGPVFADRDLKPWLHINAVGSDFAGKMELPRSVLERSFVCADYPDQCLEEGECQQLSRSQINVTLVDLVRKPDRPDARERLSVFDSTGWALQDHVTAEILVSEAQRLGLGTWLDIEVCSPDDAKDPYGFVSEPSFAASAESKLTGAYPKP